MTSNRYLEAVRRIPKGETRTFLEVASMAGRPGAARAAGRALAGCPTTSRMPWHRVVAADGSLPPRRAAEQLRRLRRERSRPRERESIEVWARRAGASILGRLPARVFLPSADPRCRDWSPLQIEPLSGRVAALSRGFAPLDRSREIPAVPRRRRARPGPPPPTIESRLAAVEWDTALEDLSGRGFLHVPGLLVPAECEALIGHWPRRERFDRTIVMGPKGYGVGEYRYWKEPLPEPARSVRRLLYRRLRASADLHRARKPGEPGYPPSLRGLWALSRDAGQRRPSSILLRYGAGGINHPHRDIYGKVWFPFQALVVLSRVGRDFDGGEFSLIEEMPGGKERWGEVWASEGDLVVFCSRERWARLHGRPRKIELRHAMKVISQGERFGLGIVFPLAA